MISTEKPCATLLPGERENISPALNAADGQPLAVLAQNPVTRDTVHSSYGNSGKMSHLGGFGLRMAHIAVQKPSHGETKPYP